MHATRGVVLAMASVLSAAVPEPAPAAGPNSTVLLSRPSGLGALPTPGDNEAFTGRKAISGNGRFIVFASAADDLGVRDALFHVWVRDTLSGLTTLVDRVPGGGAPGNGIISSVAISRDGSTVCFSGDPTNLVAGATGVHVFVATLSTGAIVVADRAAGPGGALGNDDAGPCALDATGTHVVFSSRADKLVPNDTNESTDVFVRDLAANTTTRVSVGPMGVQAPDGGFGAAISADGLKFAFITRDALVALDTNGTLDVYVRNTQAGTTVRASVGTGGVEAEGPSIDAVIDDAGTHVAFVSLAENLDLAGDGNGRRDVFWRDLVSDTTLLVSRVTGAAGAPGDRDSDFPAISGDGLGVAFESQATNLGESAPPAGGAWVYLRRLGTNLTSLLSRATGAAGARADAVAGSVSLGKEPTVATWVSAASNLDPAASGEFTQVFKRDLWTPATTLVSRPSGTGARSAAVNDSPPAGPRAISADGRLVVIESSADGLDPAAAGRIAHIFVRDAAANTTTLVSRGAGPAGPPGRADSRDAAINAAGTHVAYISDASNLLGDGEGPPAPQVYVRDLSTGAQQVASRADGPAGAFAQNVRRSTPDLSADGRRVVFVARDPLVPADTNSDSDVYMRDLVAGTTTLVSVAAGGGAGDLDSVLPSMSDDGMRVAFRSRATDLLGGPPISGDHVYVRDLRAGTTVLADRDAQGVPGAGNADRPEISGAGNRVAFFAEQPLTADLIVEGGAFYVRDLDTDTTLLVSRADGPDGVATSAAPNKSTPPSLSHDGTRVGWAGSSAALPGGTDTLQVYVRDLVANTTRLVSAVDGSAATPGNGESFLPALSADGRCVAFYSVADNLTVPAYPTQDFAQAYLRAVEGECPALTTGTTTTSTTLPPGSGRPISARAFVLKPGKLAKLVANGVPADGQDTTRHGATLLVNGTTGSASYTLPATGWKAVSRRRPKGFKFKSAACRVALLRRKLTATCRGDTGGLHLPEPGPVGIVLIVGGEAYCAECGGRAAGRATRVFKRKACPAPPSCP